MGAPTYFGSASNPADNGSQADNATVAVTPPGSMVYGDLVIFIGQVQVNTPSSAMAISNAGGQSWSSASVIQGTSNDQSFAVFWCQFNGTWSANPSIVFASESGTQPVTAIMHVFRPDVVGTWAVDTAIAGGAEASASPVVIDGITPVHEHAVVLAGWAIPNVSTWGTLSGAGWAVVATAQYRNTAGSDQSSAFAYQLQRYPAATGNVSLVPSSAAAGISFTMAWWNTGTVTFMEPGTDATQDFNFYSSTTGTITSDNTIAFTGPRSIKTDAGSPVTVAGATANGVLGDAGRRISSRYRFSSGSNANIFDIQTSGALRVLLLTIFNNKLRLQDSTNVIGADGATTLSVNTWYRISISYVLTATNSWRAKIYLNGVLELDRSNTDRTLIRVGSERLMLRSGTGATANSNQWWDDIYVDDGSDYSDPGDIQVTSKRPLSNGTTNGFTTQIGSGGSGYGSGHAPQVNERPLSTTNGWSMVGAGSAVTEEYNVEGLGVGDAGVELESNIIDVAGWVYAKSLASETAKIIVNGVSSPISLTSTNAMFVKSHGSSAKPAGTGADIGITTSTDLTTVSLYEGGILISYRAYQNFKNPMLPVYYPSIVQ